MPRALLGTQLPASACALPLIARTTKTGTPLAASVEEVVDATRLWYAPAPMVRHGAQPNASVFARPLISARPMNLGIRPSASVEEETVDAIP